MSGSEANHNGKLFENNIENYYVSIGYTPVQRKNVGVVKDNLLIKNYRITAKDNDSGYGRVEFFDSTINHIIECKYQDVSGTAFDKVANTIWRLAYQEPPSIIVYGGSKFTENKIAEFKEQIKSSTVHHKRPSNHVRLMEEQEFYDFRDSLPKKSLP